MNTSNNFEFYNESSFLKCCDSLYDAVVKDGDIKFDPSQQSFDMHLLRDETPTDVSSSVFFLLFLKRIKVSVIRTHLHIDLVSDVRIDTADKTLKVHTFDECRIEANRHECAFVFSEVLRIFVKVRERWCGYIKDEAEWGYRYYWLFLGIFWWTNTRIYRKDE